MRTVHQKVIRRLLCVESIFANSLRLVSSAKKRVYVLVQGYKEGYDYEHAVLFTIIAVVVVVVFHPFYDFLMLFTFVCIFIGF